MSGCPIIDEFNNEEDVEIEDFEDSEETRPNESQNEKFKRLAAVRTNKLLIAIKKIANLSNRINYQYSQEEVERMFSSIEERLKLAKEEFNLPNEHSR